MKKILATVMLTCVVPLSFAALPKFLLTPVTPVRMQVATNQTAIVQYRVLNQTEVARVLTIQPIPGVVQLTGDPGFCNSPFALAPHTSCLLTLQFNPVSNPGLVKGGPVVCKTKSNTDVSPDPYLCSKPETKNQLEVLRNAPQNVYTGLSLSPSELTLTSGSPFTPGNITVTNHSSTLTAQNVHADFSGTILDGNVTEDASNCQSLGPNQSCQLVFTPTNTPISLTSFPVLGSNVSAVGAQIQVTNPAVANLTASGSPLVVTAGSSGTITLSNSSSSLTASAVVPTLPSALLDIGVTFSPLSCDIAPQSTCTFTFSSPNDVSAPTSLVSFKGSNTQEVGASIAVSAVSSLVVSGSPLSILTNGTGTLTLTNTGMDPLEGVNANFAQTALNGNVTASGCETIAPAGSCVMTFTAGNTAVSSTSFSIETTGDPTIATSAMLSIQYPALGYFGNGIEGIQSNGETPIVNICSVDDTGFSSCANSGISSLFINNPQGMAANQDKTYFYIANASVLPGDTEYSILKCALDQLTGNISNNCAVLEDPTFYYPTDLALNTNVPVAYVASSAFVTSDSASMAKSIQQCPVNADGSFGACSNLSISDLQSPAAIVLNQDNTMAYIANAQGNSISQCPIDVDGNMQTTCTTTQVNPSIGSQPLDLVIAPNGQYLYVIDFLNTLLYQCSINGSDYVTTCTSLTALPTDDRPSGIAINSLNTMLYVTRYSSSTLACPIVTTGGTSTVTSCSELSQPNSEYSVSLLND